MVDDNTQPDEALIRGIANGDVEMLRALYERHAPLLNTLGFRILGQGDDVSELLIDVFDELWNQASDYDPRRGGVKAHLVLRMRTLCLEKLRAREGKQGVSTHASQPQADKIDPESEASLTTVQQAVGLLDKQQRAAIELSFYEGLTQREIATRLGSPLVSVKGRLRSGLVKLSRALHTLEEDAEQ